VVTITNIDRGSTPGDGTGDTPYTASGVINTNFSNVKTSVELIEKGYVGQRLDTTTSYGLVLADAGRIVEVTNASACGVVIPANSAVAFPVDTRIDIVQGGAGLLTVTITNDTLLGDAVSQGEGKPLSLWKKSATVWRIFGGGT